MTSFEATKLKIFDQVRDLKKEKTLKTLIMMNQDQKLAKTMGKDYFKT
jgi:hypothetical protein